MGLVPEPQELVFRANLCHLRAGRLASFSAHAIGTGEASALVDKVCDRVRETYPRIALLHMSDYRCLLRIRCAGVDPADLRLLEPHEVQGCRTKLGELCTSNGPAAEDVCVMLMGFCNNVAKVLDGCRANFLWPWSPSKDIELPRLESRHEWTAPAAIVGAMDFLGGICSAGGMDFYKIGNGRVDTSYVEKGRQTLELLKRGYRFVLCHVNAPDEAAHEGDFRAKVWSIERFDRCVVAPVVRYFQNHPDRLGTLVVVPDHYTNTSSHRTRTAGPRRASHDPEPVPFAMWARDGRRDLVPRLTEDLASYGRYATPALEALSLLSLLSSAGLDSDPENLASTSSKRES